MPKYEIMLILDPKVEESKTKKLLDDIFGKKIEKFEKLDRTELAYKIDNSTTAKYYLANVDSAPENISEFVRKANLLKDIWRFLTINLDEEKANKEIKPRRPFNNRRSFGNNSNRDNFRRPRDGKFVRKTFQDRKPSESKQES